MCEGVRGEGRRVENYIFEEAHMPTGAVARATVYVYERGCHGVVSSEGLRGPYLYSQQATVQTLPWGSTNYHGVKSQCNPGNRSLGFRRNLHTYLCSNDIATIVRMY